MVASNVVYDIKAACEAQDKMCDERKLPHFAPLSGTCFYCGKNIYADGGISVKEASTRLITGCPYCGRSYCE